MPSNSKKTTLTAALSLTAATLTHAQGSFGNYSTISNVSTSACPGEGGAHIIVARASLEPLGYGIIGAVKDHIIANNSASNAEYVNYPAVLSPDYFASERAGVTGMKELVENFLAQDCPNDPPIVLLGYSQGAQVVADYLSGQSIEVFSYNETFVSPAPSTVFDRLAAAVVMGDPSINITDSTYHIGNSTRSGIFARLANSSAVLESVAPRLRSYCDAGDPYCESGNNFSDIIVHLTYTETYGRQAAPFVVGKIAEYYANSSASATNGSNATQTGSGSKSSYTGAAASMRVGSTVGVVFALGAAFLCGL